MVESIQIEHKYVDQISLLDKELNLYSYRVDENKKSFEPFGCVKNLSDKLELDSKWLNFNEKEPIDYEDYKPNYRLYSAETVGVVIGDYIVY